MSFKGIFFVVLMAVGAVLNYASKPISEKTGKEELKIKIAGLIFVVIGMVLLMIFGK